MFHPYTDTGSYIIRQRMFFLLVFGLISLAVAMASHIVTLQTESNLCGVHLQSAMSENQKLVQLEKSYKMQLKLVINTNQKLNEEKKDLRNEIEQINTDFKTIKDKNEVLFEEKKELKKKINGTNAELHAINETLLDERKKLNSKVNELQSAEDDAQRLTEEKEKLQNEIGQLKLEI